MNSIAGAFKGLVELSCDGAVSDPDRVAFTYLDFPSRRGARKERSLTIGELDACARAIAIALQQTAAPGDRALLLFRPGLDFVSAFLGCLYAGVVAVPAPVPRHGLAADRVRSILADSNARIALSTRSTMAPVLEHVAGSDALGWVLVEEVDRSAGRGWVAPSVGRDDLALLQYSSGSTGEPKGVMISHGNLVHQAQLLCDVTGTKRLDCWLAWLPIYHDMGLISAIVAPLAKQLHSVFMAPEAFILRPARWLQAMTDFRAACCASPNFGYELCTRKVTDEELETIDLSGLGHAVTGAEPIRANTIDRFVERFSPRGFRREAFYPAYGLAEATLLVTGRQGEVKARGFELAGLEAGQAVPVDAASATAVLLVSSGSAQGGNDVRIVDPETSIEAGPLQVGEIWVAGDGVGLGYWGNDEARNAAFAGRLRNDPAIAYLRTGDMGFLHEGELFVRGRLKDLIIIRGANHYAPDIEQTAQASHAALAPSGSAAFSVEVDNEERLVVVQELERGGAAFAADVLDGIAASIRQNISERHQVAPCAVVLLANGMPKTSSGKVRRQECRSRYLAGTLKPVHVWSRGAEAAGADRFAGAGIEEKAMRRQVDCELWLTRMFAAVLRIDGDAIDAGTSIKALALDTAAITKAAQEIKTAFGLVVPFTMFSDHETIGELAHYLASSSAQDKLEKPARGAGLAVGAFAFTPDKSVESTMNEPIAIVGMACRFPAAGDMREFWRNICAGVDAVGDIPEERWNGEALYDENPLAMGKMNTKRGGFLKNIESFDGRFFGIQAREATRMDPAHRVLLELSWEVFEDAGVLPGAVSGAHVGVYVGISGSDYAQLQFGDEALSDPYAGIGCALTNSASRISHFHNLRGPALAIDTACSSALSAMHLGCMAIRSGECDMALAGGVNIILSPTVTMSLSKAGMMAPDGRCKTFDKDADGYVRSEGAGLVLLKPLAKALRDGDSVYAVIRGSATNQDGRSSAISAPNGEAQQRVVLAACESAGVFPGQLDYVEAHGTGTALGDPIEVNALGEVLKIGADAGSHCAIGSVKTNIGHCESAAGAASLIKVALMLDTKQIPPSLNFSEPNPLISFENYAIQVQRELGPLPVRSRPRLAGVNSFGIGGTNVHFVLEEFPTGHDIRHGSPGDADPSDLYILPLSAKSENSLKANAKAMADFLSARGDEVSMADVCHTMSQRRTHFDHRLSVVGGSAGEVAAALESHLLLNYHADVHHGHRPAALGEAPRIAFVFSGQGSQWFAMGRRLFETEPVYRKEIERFDAQLRPHTGWSLIEVLMASEEESLLGETAYGQPTFFALQCSLVALLGSWGIVPDAVVGHSFGEVAAAYVSGALTFGDACFLIATRARLMQSAKGKGRMASIEMTRADMEAELEAHGGELCIAASNGPGTTVVSGAHEAMDRLVEAVKARGITVIELALDYAFHSAQMEDVKHDFIDQIAAIRPLPPVVPLMSTVTADWCEGTALLDPAYWGENIRREVRFRDAIDAIARHGTTLFLEIGAHPVLSGAVARILKAAGIKGTALPTLERDLDDRRALMRTAASLHSLGCPIQWASLQPPGRYVRGLPHYCWDRQRFWMDAPHLEARTRVSEHPLVSIRMPVASPTWQSRLDGQTHPYLTAMRLRGEPRLANGLLVELALEAAIGDETAPGTCEMIDLAFGDLRLAGADPVPVLQTTIHRDADGRRHARVAVQPDDSQGRARLWQEMLSGQVTRRARGELDPPARMPVEEMKSRYPQKFSGTEAYRKLGEVGIQYGPALQVAGDVWLEPGSALVGLRVGEMLPADAGKYHLHPLVFDAIEQAGRLAVGSGAAHATLGHVRRIRVFEGAATAAYAYATLVEGDGFRGRRGAQDMARVHVWILDAAGEVVAIAEDAGFAAIHLAEGDEFGIPEDIGQWRYHVEWKAMPAPQLVGNPHGEGGRWLIFADQGGTGEEVGRWLRAKGQECVVVRAGEAYARKAADEFAISPRAPEDVERLVREVFTDEGSVCRGVVHLWSLDATPVGQTSEESLQRDYALGVLSVTDIVRAVSASDAMKAPRLWIVSGGAQPAGPDAESLEIAQSLVWGCAKSIVLEHAELRCCRIDLSAGRTAQEVQLLCEELWADRVDDQVAFRGGERYVAQLDYQLQPVAGEPEPQAVPSLPGASARTNPARPASGRGTGIERNRRRSPGFGEVELRTEVAGRASGSGAKAETSPWQCVGRVVRVGPDVTDLQVGQRVLALEPGSLGAHRLVQASGAVPLPPGLEAADAIASARPYLSALFALREMGSVARGDSVLIRIGNDASALAAVRVAKWLDAKVHVAAPTHMHAQVAALKVVHVFDEGDPSAHLDIRVMTEGRGVDLLVNYGANFESSACAHVLRPFGRCIDLAKGGGGGSAGLLHSNLPGNVSFLAVDEASLVTERKDFARGLLSEVMDRLADGTFEPQARRTYSLADLDAGIAADQTGEVIVDLAAEEASDGAADATAYHRDATYVITGGLGGLGLNIAARMVRDGARHVVLLGRKPPSLAAMDVIAELAEFGARCVPMSVDVADEASLRQVLEEVRRTLPPIRGILHAAGILDNGLLVQMDHRQVLAVMPAKVNGAWNLHRLTADDELDFFVMFSSLASFIGSPGQSNYAAANAFLEALAEYRARNGKTGLSIAWGPWAEAGMAADVHNLQRLAQHGMGMIQVGKGMDLLEDVILERQQGAIGAMPMNWAAWGNTRGYAAQTPYFAGLVPQGMVVRSNQGKITAESLVGLDDANQMERLQAAVLRAVCQSMMLDAEAIDMDLPLTAVGLDSIVALELKDRIESGIDVVVRTNALIAGKSIRILARQFQEELQSGAGRSAAAPAAAIDPAAGTDGAGSIDAGAILEALDDLSPQEIEAMLLELASAEDGT